MKFKIDKNQFDFFTSMFKDKGSAYIELEPVFETATEAIANQQLSQKAYDSGYKHGYAQGFHDGRRRDYSMGCDFGSKDGDSVVVAMKKPDGSIEILKTL